MTETVSVRLPNSVSPRKYVLSLKPDLQTFTFEGEEDVVIDISEEVSSVVLNAAELQIHHASVQLPDGAVAHTKSVDFNETAETVTLTFDRPLPKGSATLSLRFAGTLNNRLLGFYRSEYTTPEGEKRFMAATQFEATDARRAFPCWDEPAQKAAFQVTLVIPSALTAISNTHVVEEKDLGDGTKAVTFAETPPMSTYLLAFVVGDLASVEAKAGDGTLIRVWATPDRAHLGDLALETSVSILDYMNEYFGIPYPLEKLDHIALPDFAAGAMENWGAITYRERILLYDPLKSTAITKQSIAEVIAHEMAHMWFGDLVTMEWWDDLWLNESFASWMGNKAVDELYPEWSMWTQFLQDAAVGFSLDGLRSSHPIEATVRDPAEIEEIFDAISYQKGAAILWMLEQFIGEEAFQKGMHLYLSAHRYGNARTKDLWKALSKASGEDVTGLMDTWVKQTGFPMLSVKTLRENSDLNLSLTQTRFLYEHLLEGEEDATVWKVPISIQRAGGVGKATLLMEKRSQSHVLSGERLPEVEDWVKINAGQAGFYRVNYPPEEWERLLPAVEGLSLPATDRLGLQNDAYALSRGGFMPATLYLSVTQAYINEEDAAVWAAISANLRDFEANVVDAPYLPQFRAFARGLYRPVAKRIGWDSRPEEGHLDALLRTFVLGRLGLFDDEETAREAARRFEAYLEDPASLNPDLQDVVFSLAAYGGDRSVYEQLWDLEREAVLNEEKVRLLVALARPKRGDLLKETLERSLSDDVRSQDTVLVVTTVGSHPYGRDLAWEFIKDNWSELDRRYRDTGFMMRRLVGVTEAFTTLERAEEVGEFFRAHPIPAAKMKIQQSLERIRLNAKWVEINGDGLQKWFDSMDRSAPS